MLTLLCRSYPSGFGVAVGHAAQQARGAMLAGYDAKPELGDDEALAIFDAFLQTPIDDHWEDASDFVNMKFA